MREMPRRGLAALALACALGLGGCATATAQTSADPQDLATIERGRYLTQVGDCAACHTDPADHRAFAGGRAIQTPFGIVVAPNITPDRETGIGDWSAEQFEAALRLGRMPDGRRLYPAMPFPYYTRMASEDVRAIRAYLRTVEPVHHAVEPDRLPFPFSIRASLWFWDALYLDAGEFHGNPAESPQWNRGAYLVEGPGHCGACHTPKTVLGGDKRSEKFRGYSIQGWFAPDISDDEGRGLANWSVTDVVDYLRNGHNRLAAAAGPMGEEVANSSSGMSSADLTAIATYLKSRSGSEKATAAASLSADRPAMQAGAAIYQDLCAACHKGDGSGVAFLIPNLAEANSVASREPTSLLRVVIKGAGSVATAAEPTGPAMPAYGDQLSDAQIAAVITYVRNSWGHSGKALTPGDVSRARRALQESRD
jgi:mono/diheme cytochrome c family protein